MHTDHLHSRRIFFKQLLSGTSVLFAGLYAACRPRDPLAHIRGSIVGANASVGHLMRNVGALPAPSYTIDKDILIIGSGISGLSAMRWLAKEGHTDVMLIEMDDHYGGNATYGKNKVSAYPWGAHYIPVPDTRNRELLDFLAEINVITGFSEEHLPVYNDYYMCHDPEERLFINGLWQDGIVPEIGVPAVDKEQIKRFAYLVNGFKVAVGSDGKDAFTIPLDNSSADEQFRKLDRISFRQYLDNEGYTSKYLRWYLEYGCKDDYACNLDNTSAWAGIHYFASRKGKGANATSSTVLTWPQGNGFLMDGLRQQLHDSTMLSSQLAYNIEIEGDRVEVKVYDVEQKHSYVINAGKVLLASPQFVNRRLLSGGDFAAHVSASADFHYAPWVIANITINDLPQARGLPLCWDNVIYGTRSVGYVDANHQDLNNSRRRVITFYLPLIDQEPDAARHYAQTKDHKYWMKLIAEELEYAHPGITPAIEAADIWVWGHGMISPRPGFIWGRNRPTAATAIGNKVFFAHSDLSGVSIFEEAFYQGIRAARQIIAAV